MEKVLVEVWVPVENHAYDVLIPQTSKMGEIVALVSKVLSELSAGKFKPDASTVLCDAETGNIFNINLSVYELGIKNGSKLILI